jgi:hypothetical protein
MKQAFLTWATREESKGRGRRRWHIGGRGEINTKNSWCEVSGNLNLSRVMDLGHTEPGKSTRVAPTEPGLQETWKFFVSAEPGHATTFASMQPGPVGVQATKQPHHASNGPG